MRFDFIDDLLAEYRVQVVGNGYLDCIVKRTDLIPFVDFLNANSISITAVSWWCHCVDYNKIKYGCPHGYGGVKSVFYEGYFSELPFASRRWGFTDNADVLDYVLNRATLEQFYSGCLVPGLCLQF